MPNSTVNPDFDGEEREFASALGTRKSSCPPMDVLLAVGQEVLPTEVETAASKHLAQCKLCSTLLADLATSQAQPMTASEQQRIASTLPATKRGPRNSSMRTLMAIAAVLLLSIAGILLLRSRHTATPQSASNATSTQATPPRQAAPTTIAELSIPLTPLAPPSEAAIATRGGNNATPSTAELLPAFESYNHGNYNQAAQRFTVLSKTYPNNATINLYLGVSELFLSQDEQAQTHLRAVKSTNTTPTQQDAALWYSAIAATRLHPEEAKPILNQLCNNTQSAYSAQSCHLTHSEY